MPARRLALALLAGCVTGFGLIPPSSAQCPASAVRCELDEYAPVGPTYSLVCSNVILGVSTIDFDVPGRSARLSSFDSNAGAELSLIDTFVANGPLPGPIPLRLRLRVSGYTHGAGRAIVGAYPTAFQAGDDTTSRTFTCAPSCGSPTPFADSLDLALTRTAGAPFGLVLHAFTGVDFGARLDIRFEFVGLPPGVTVTSCKGFNQEPPVPTLARSWGSVKACYR